MRMLTTRLKKWELLRRCVRAVRSAKSAARGAWITYSKKGNLPYALNADYTFEDRRSCFESVLLILAGYKQPLWNCVLGRVKKFIPPNLDVCIVLSGTDNDHLKMVGRSNGWSYLAVNRNNVCLAQNVAIHLHPDARWIYKIDEDMFLCEGFFERLRYAYETAPTVHRIDVGFCAPLIPVNGYGHVRILKRTGLVDLWEKQFGPLFHTEGLHRYTAIQKDIRAAEFMWGDGIPALSSIDSLNEMLCHSAQSCLTTICPHRFSIGAILFERTTWEDFGMFPVSLAGTDLGHDEQHFCQYCMMHSKAIVVAENAVAGHLGFGPQTAGMLDYFKMHPDVFSINS